MGSLLITRNHRARAAPFVRRLGEDAGGALSSASSPAEPQLYLYPPVHQSSLWSPLPSLGTLNPPLSAAACSMSRSSSVSARVTAL
jgi:hypothetical protein